MEDEGVRWSKAVTCDAWQTTKEALGLGIGIKDSWYTTDVKRGHKHAARRSKVSSDAAACMQRDFAHSKGAVVQRQTVGETGQATPSERRRGEHRSVLPVEQREGQGESE